MKAVLPVDGPLDPGATLARDRIWGEDPANRVSDDRFRRVLRLDGRLVPYEVRWSGTVDDAKLTIDVPDERAPAVREAVLHEVRRIFGLDFDLPGFYRVAKADPVLAEVVAALYGMRPTLAPGGLEMLVGSITAQQVNLTFAFTLRARLVRRYGAPVSIGGDTVYAFPEARALAGLRVATLRAMQFSNRKAEYIRDVARAIVAGQLDLDALAAAPNADVIAALTALRGLGRWTADWYLARHLARPHAWPAGDLGLRKAVSTFYAGGSQLSIEEVRRMSERFAPFENLSAQFLLVGARMAG